MRLRRVPYGRVACLGWACGAFGMGVWRVWDGRVACLGWACGVFGMGVWRVWDGRVACSSALSGRYMLHRLAARQRRQAGVRRDERYNPVRVGLAVRPKCPADTLTYEEVTFIQIRLYAIGEQLGVGGGLRPDLADHSCSPQPQLASSCPDANNRRHLVRVCAQQRSYSLGREQIHIIPPRSVDDQLLV
jgi:hypothetical protein